MLGHVRALASRLLDEPGVGPIVAAQLLVAWSHPGRVRSEDRLRQARRRSPGPSQQRPDHPPPTQPRRRPATQPRPPHRHPAPPPARPSHEDLHRAPNRRRKEPPRRRPPAQALPRPPPLPTTATGAADDLTSHRSIIPATLAQATVASGLTAVQRPCRDGGASLPLDSSELLSQHVAAVLKTPLDAG
jgi:hypothetical protein